MHFGGLGPDMLRMGLRRLILSTLAPWAQIWPKLRWASTFWCYLRGFNLGPRVSLGFLGGRGRNPPKLRAVNPNPLTVLRPGPPNPLRAGGPQH